MYESFFGLRRRPFPAAADTQSYQPLGSIENARQTLARVIARAEGVGVILGPAGTGKTLLCRLLAGELAGQFHVALLAGGRLATRRALLQALSHALNLPYRGLAAGELRLALIDRLSGPAADGRPLVAIADNAHGLPARLLDELCMLTDLASGGQSLVRLILSGSTSLDERLTHARLDSLNQRIAARGVLEPLGAHETAQYIRQQVAQAGVEPSSAFDDAALDAAYRAADGVPRLINQVCDHALILAMLEQVRPVTAALVQEAWSDLAQLPNPANSLEPGEGGATIEFGQLDGTADEDAACLPFRTAGEASADAGSPESGASDDEFLPAGTIRPELTIDFGTAGNPFVESFDHEEVVLDRYAAADAEPWSNRPIVASREGRELAKLLAAFRATATASVDVAPEFHLTRDWAGGQPPAVPAPSGNVGQQSPATVSAGAPAAASSPGEQVAETSPAGSVPRPAPVVRRGGYRQLFAKLRG